MEKDLVQENWSKDGEWAVCRHDDCHYFKRKHGKKRRILCRIFDNRIEFKCDSCGGKNTYKFVKEIRDKSKIDENTWIPLESMIAEWEKK